MQTATQHGNESVAPSPVADLFPPQGHWSESDYLELETNRLIELVDGRLEVLPMPTSFHQWIVRFLEMQLVAASGPRNVVSAPYRLRVAAGRYREPDILYSTNELELGDSKTDSAELVIEIVSEGDAQRERDYVDKRRDYAAAGVKEYWIVDPQQSSVTVMERDGEELVIREDAKTSGTLRSSLLPKFEVDAAALFTQFA